MKNGDIGSYCYDIALSALQGSSSVDFSPNNVRRIVISSDGVLIQKFIGTPSQPTLSKVAAFNPMKTVDCFSSRSFKPIVKCLTDLVCSNVEEIIFCTSSKSGVSMSQLELNLSELLKGYSGSLNPDLIKSLLGRFVRLRSITFFTGTLDSLQPILTSRDSSAYLLAGDKDLSQMCTCKLTDNVDWYKNRRLRPQHYMLDVDNGKLWSYFSKVESAIKAKESEVKVARVQSDRLSSRQTSLDARCKAFTSVYSKIARLVTIVTSADLPESVKLSNSTSVTALVNVLKDCSKGIVIPDLPLDKLLPKEAVNVFSASHVDTSIKEEVEKYDLLIEDLRVVVVTLYSNLFVWFLNQCIEDYSKFGLTTKVKLENMPADKLFIPKGTESLVREFESVSGKVLGSTSASASTGLSVICAYSIKLLLSKSLVKDSTVLAVQYWDNLGGK